MRPKRAIDMCIVTDPKISSRKTVLFIFGGEKNAKERTQPQELIVNSTRARIVLFDSVSRVWGGRADEL
ncbi:unnamed protein product [Soboliphyme baturini]|uniref:AAA_12 domain-containing protein n=1 Tax=Soboliphyme baturini TaxID=241478 RepID=A0A183IEC2_9BILA|nr:unnamed protein product [Soboliphyme baturini]